MKIRKVNMDNKYEGMIKEVSSDIVFDLQESALQCAWTATAIPVEFWEQTVSEAVKEVVKDILQDLNKDKDSNRIAGIIARLRRLFSKKPEYDPFYREFLKEDLKDNTFLGAIEKVRKLPRGGY
jgi:hypothetical protein